jgi:photosystem II stability/assembly factor-like uncharacterized protein
VYRILVPEPPRGLRSGPGGHHLRHLDGAQPSPGSGLSAIAATSATDAWTAQPVWDVHFVDATTGWVVATDGLLFKTTDAGATRMQQTVPGTQPAVRNVDFLDATTGWAGGTLVSMVQLGSVWKTSSGGGTIWTFQASAPYLHAIRFVDQTTGYAVGDGGALWKTITGGQ